MSTRSVAASLIFALSFPAAVSAAPDARTRYDSGIRHYRVGEFEAAIADFKAAYDLDPSPVLLFNLAQAHRQLGDERRALFFYRQFVAQAPASKARTDAEAIIAELEGTPKVDRPQKPQSSTVQASPVTPTAYPVQHAGVSHRQAVALVASTGALGGALVLTGIGLSVHAKNESDSLQRVPAGTAWSHSYSSRYDSGRASSEAATALYVIGGVSIAVSVVSAIVLRRALHQPSSGALSWSF